MTSIILGDGIVNTMKGLINRFGAHVLQLIKRARVIPSPRMERRRLAVSLAVVDVILSLHLDILPTELRHEMLILGQVHGRRAAQHAGGRDENQHDCREGCGRNGRIPKWQRLALPNTEQRAGRRRQAESIVRKCDTACVSNSDNPFRSGLAVS